MIPKDAIIEWQERAPWPDLAQIQQDLILTKAVIQIYNNLKSAPPFAMRGGTAMQKFFFSSPTRN